MTRMHDHEEEFARRFGRGGPPFGGPGFGGGGFGGRGGFGRGGGRGRVRRGQIRTALLALLEEQPMHGYEMIRLIDERSGGRWKPSPGAVYPTLSQLSDEGLVTATEDGGKRVFSLTDEGRDAVAGLSDEDREPWVHEGEGHPAFELRAVMHQLALALRSVAVSGSPAQMEEAKAILSDARRRIYALLAEEPDETPPG